MSFKKRSPKKPFNPANYDENGVPITADNTPSRVRKARKDFFMCQNMIFDQPLHAYSKLVFTYLCRAADNEDQSFPGKQHIADMCSISKSSVYRAINELVEYGLITSEAQYDPRQNGRQTSNLYTVYDEPGAAYKAVYEAIMQQRPSTFKVADMPPPVIPPPTLTLTPDPAPPTVSDSNPSAISQGNSRHVPEESTAVSDRPANNNTHTNNTHVRGGGKTAAPSSLPAAEPPPPPPDERECYGELFKAVTLHSWEFKGLVDMFNAETVNDYIGRLDAHIASSGRKYTSHYATIIKWVKEDNRKATSRTKTNSFMNFNQRSNDFSALEKMERAYRDQKYGVVKQE